MAGRQVPDAGFSLIELLIATAIMGTAVIALVTGMGTLLNSSSQNRQATTSAIVGMSFRLRRDPNRSAWTVRGELWDRALTERVR